MGTKYATDALFIDASTIGDTCTIEEETRVPCDAPQPIESVPVQSEQGKEPIPPRPLPRFRRYGLKPGPVGEAGEPAEIEPERPYWRRVTVVAPVLPAAVEFSYDRLFRDPDLADLATNLIRVPVGPAQSLFARLKATAEEPLVLSILIDPQTERR